MKQRMMKMKNEANQSKNQSENAEKHSPKLQILLSRIESYAKVTQSCRDLEVDSIHASHTNSSYCNILIARDRAKAIVKLFESYALESRLKFLQSYSIEILRRLFAVPSHCRINKTKQNRTEQNKTKLITHIISQQEW
jgi:hypothetical protein